MYSCFQKWKQQLWPVATTFFYCKIKQNRQKKDKPVEKRIRF